MFFSFFQVYYSGYHYGYEQLLRKFKGSAEFSNENIFICARHHYTFQGTSGENFLRDLFIMRLIYNKEIYL